MNGRFIRGRPARHRNRPEQCRRPDRGHQGRRQWRGPQPGPLCSYGLTAALPPIVENLRISGNHATIERSAAAGTPEFAILTVGLNHGPAIGTLATSNLNIRNGDPGILVQGTLSVQDGTFISNHAAAGGAITVSDPTSAGRP